MNKESLTVKLLDLAEGRETPETWRSWWDEHESELETLLNRGEFLKLKPCRHGFQWVPVFGSQKGAIAILEKSGTAFEASNLYQERYLAELEAFCKEQELVAVRFFPELAQHTIPLSVDGQIEQVGQINGHAYGCLDARGQQEELSHLGRECEVQHTFLIPYLLLSGGRLDLIRGVKHLCQRLGELGVSAK